MTLFLTCTDHDDPIQNDKITLTYWSANNQYEMDLAAKLVLEWNEKYPDVQVKHQPIPESRSSEEVILASVVGKKTPDVYSNMWPGDVALYVRANVLENLDQFVDFDSLANDRYDPEKYKESKHNDGHVYQILWKTNPIMLIYNKKIFKEAGYENPPETYAEYLDLAEKVSKDTNGDGYVDRWVGITQILVTWWQRFFDYYTLYIAATGGKTFLEGDSVTFNNEMSVQVYRFLQTLFKKNYFPLERMDARADVFLHSIVASRFTGPWEITHAEKFKPEGFEFDFAPVPRPAKSGGPSYTYGDYKSIVIFKNTKYPQESWEFVKYLVSKKADLQLLQSTDQLPVRKNILSDSLFQPYFENNPMMLRFAKQAQFVRGVDSSPVLREIFDAISQEFEACVIYGKKTPEEAVENAARRAKLVME
ncbi:extracellular solute-binding protein [candidate division KSB1 bacterium]|nr:extracellular solute-binding protein [candidate division KSB1 bacterium]